MLCWQHMCVRAGACKGIRLPEDGIVCGCELLDLGAGNGTLGLCKRNVCSQALNPLPSHSTSTC